MQSKIQNLKATFSWMPEDAWHFYSNENSNPGKDEILSCKVWSGGEKVLPQTISFIVSKTEASQTNFSISRIRNLLQIFCIHHKSLRNSESLNVIEILFILQKFCLASLCFLLLCFHTRNTCCLWQASPQLTKHYNLHLFLLWVAVLVV